MNTCPPHTYIEYNPLPLPVTRLQVAVGNEIRDALMAYWTRAPNPFIGAQVSDPARPLDPWFVVALLELPWKDEAALKKAVGRLACPRPEVTEEHAIRAIEEHASGRTMRGAWLVGPFHMAQPRPVADVPLALIAASKRTDNVFLPAKRPNLELITPGAMFTLVRPGPLKRRAGPEGIA